MSVNTAQNQLSVEGNCVVSVLYLSDDSKLHCFEQRLPFSKLVDVRRTEDCIFFADASSEYVNCRVLSQRRIDIHAGISLNYKAYCKKQNNIFSACDEKSVQLSTQNINMCNLQDFNCRYFNVNETVEINGAQPTINQIVRSDAQIVLESTKVITGKILVKGTVISKILYLSENDSQLQRLESTVPVSQIIEIGADDDSFEYVSLSLTGIDVFAKTDSSGALRLIDLSAVVCAQIAVYDNGSGTVVNDAYSTEYLLENRQEEVSVLQLSDRINENFLVRGDMEITDDTVSSVLDLSVEGVKYEYRYADGKFEIKGVMSVNALLETAGQGVRSADRQIEFEYSKNIVADDEIKPEFDLASTAVTYTIQGDSKLDIRAELEINGVLFNVKKIKLISDININEEAKKEKSGSSLTVYFADKGENVWDIAKHYNTTVDLIMQENSLSTAEIEKNQRLLIPAI